MGVGPELAAKARRRAHPGALVVWDVPSARCRRRCGGEMFEVRTRGEAAPGRAADGYVKPRWLSVWLWIVLRRHASGEITDAYLASLLRN